MQVLRVERDSASDDEVELVEILCETGAEVTAGSVVAELEGSKSSYPLVAGAEGVIHWYSVAGGKVKVGEAVAVVLSKGETAPDIAPSVSESREGLDLIDGSSGRISSKALEYLKAQGISPEEFLPNLPFVSLDDARRELEGSTLSPDSADLARPTQFVFLGGGRGAQIARELCAQSPRRRLVGVFDDSANLIEDWGIRLLGPLTPDEITNRFLSGQFEKATITITSSMESRIRLLRLCDEAGIPLLSLIDDDAMVSPTSEVDAGTVAVSGSRIGPFARVGRNVFLSAFTNIEHHCVIGENTTFGPGVFLSGAVEVGKNCVFGTNIGVEPGIRIGEGVIIASGTTITRNVADGTIVKSQTSPVFRS